MNLNLIAFAVPVFVLLMLLEYAVSKRQKQEVFQFNEVVANLNVGIAERLSDLFTTGLFYAVFQFVYKHFALFSIEADPLTWIGLFLFTDFVWYWYHRLGHEVNLLWAFHVVHHQSEDFNYTVSARITVLQAAARCAFWSILPLIGFPPHMVAIVLLIHGAYPFFSHTQLIGRLGWLEYIFVTPSHHRVHHSSNPAYLDTNYGDVLIIWDKFFGTFAQETEPCVFGLTKPLQSYSFLWQHFHFLLELIVALRRTPTMAQRVRLLFGQPDLIDPRIRLWLEHRLSRPKSHLQPAAPLRRYIGIQTWLSIVVVFGFILLEAWQSPLQLFLGALFILASLILTGAMLEQRYWVFELEIVRFGVILGYIYTWAPFEGLAFVFIALLILLIAMQQFFSLRYYRLLYRSSTSPLAL